MHSNLTSSKANVLKRINDILVVGCRGAFLICDSSKVVSSSPEYTHIEVDSVSVVFSLAFLPSTHEDAIQMR